MPDDLTLAFDVAQEAAELALRFFQRGVDTTLKPDGSPVTEADVAVEQLLHKLLRTARQDDALLGEELGQLGAADRTWILDPIDGTKNFSRGDPHWGVQIALEIAGRIDVAVVTAPALGLQWSAERGGGTFESAWPQRRDDRRLQVSDTQLIGDALLDADNDRNRARLPPEAAKYVDGVRSWCAGLIRLVRGEVDCFFAEGHQLWDHAPWVLLVEEAGGRFTNHRGGTAPIQGGGIYSNAALHDALVSHLGYA